MKLKIFFTGLAFTLCISITVSPQVCNLPAVDLFTLDGNHIDASTIVSEASPLIMVFFKTTENKCCDHLLEICDAHESTLAGQGVKMIAICVDCEGKTEHVKPFVYGHNIAVDVYVDRNGEFKRAMGVPGAPYTLIYDQSMRVFCKYQGYCANAGEMVCEKMKECLSKMPAVH